MNIKKNIESHLVAESQQKAIQAMLDDKRKLLPHQITQLKRWQVDSLRLCERDETRLDEMVGAWERTGGAK